MSTCGLFVMLFFISPGKHVRHMVTLHTEALQARKGHVDNMAPRSKPRVKHRSSINSKGLKNKVEPSTVFADRKKNIKGNTRKDEN